MTHIISSRTALCMALATAFPLSLSAATVVVDASAPVVSGSSYQSLSSAVNDLQANFTAPHVINITNPNLSTSPAVADGPVVITTEMTINGDPNNTGAKADILVDMNALQTGPNPGQTDARCYIEVLAPNATVILNDLKIHPNGDCTGAQGTVADSVDGIRLYEPTVSGEVSTYILNRVWVSGSDGSNNYVDLATGTDVHTGTPSKWSILSGTGTVASGNNAVIQVLQGAGNATVELNNCMAGLGESNALNLNARGGSYTVKGGLYGHVSRDGIRITGNGVTLTGSPTNRLRVIRSTSVSGADAHSIEIYASGSNASRVTAMEYVDVAGANTSQLFKVWGDNVSARVDRMSLCRGMGKMVAGANPAMLVKNLGRIDNMSSCTIVGSGTGSSLNPFATDADIAADINIYDCIFASTGGGVISAVNTTNGPDGIRIMNNCAIPNDGFAGESLAAAPITGSGSTYFTPNNTVTASPHFAETLVDYDWSENAVSVDGSDTSAGNPDVLRPTNSAAYTAKRTDGGNLSGGADGTEVPVGLSAFELE